MTMAAQPWTILNYAFRPFFLLGALFGIVALALWLAALHGAGWAAAAPDPVLWHAHEMLFGFALATVAGFLLTAVATWTGRAQISGTVLGILVVAWFLGRVAMAPGGRVPGWLVTACDMLFPLLLALLAGREIIGGRSQRNLGIAVALALFAALNFLYHLGRTAAWPGGDRIAVLLSAHLLLLIVAVIGGRIVPSFTANWLRARGSHDLPVIRPWIEKALPTSMAAAGFADSLADATGLPALAVATLSLATAVLHGFRLAGWRGVAARSEPLLAVLHVAYAWLPLGYLLLGLTALGLPLPRTAALHALTMGGVGAMVLAVTTRVALGHTGRALVAAPMTVAAYVLLNAAVLVRVLSPVAPGAYTALIAVAAAGWFAAFGLFLWVYWPILTRPRIDGRPERRTPGR
jgi:uncharacterized protein involved in response to NO